MNKQELIEQIKGLKSVFTRKQLEKSGFGWVFDCEGVEIKEVTE